MKRFNDRRIDELVKFVGPIFRQDKDIPMDYFYGTGGRSSTSKNNQTLSSSGSGSGSGSGSWPDPLAHARRRLTTSPSLPSAFLNPAFDACASSPASDVDPSLLRLTRSRLLRFASSSSASNSYDQPTAASAARRLLQMKSSALSPIKNVKSAAQPKSPVYKTPVKLVDVEEDVLVMDGVLVSDSKANSRRNNSPEFGSSPNSSGSGAFYKTELCRSWEELRFCLYRSKCQFAHGEEELRCDLRGPRSWKQKKEVGGLGTRSLSSAGSGTYGSKFHRYVSLPGPNTSDSALKGKTIAKLVEVSPATSPPSSKLSSSTFAWPPTKEEDALITQVLYGPSSRRRLPVFELVCPR